MFAAHPALVLNADFQPLSYFPLSLLHWEDAVKAVVKGTHYVVEEYDRVVRSPSIEMLLPCVLALRKYRPAPKHVAFTRFNVFLCDRFRCQYCGGKFSSAELTFDHVLPRSRGGVDQRRRGLQSVQHRERQCSRHEAVARAGGADAARADRDEEGVPAELPARELGRLSLLGRRARCLIPAAGASVTPAATDLLPRGAAGERTTLRRWGSPDRARPRQPTRGGRTGEVAGAVLKTDGVERHGLRVRPSSAKLEGEPARRPAPVGNGPGAQALRIETVAFRHHMERQPGRPLVPVRSG
jgi:HNH endonuclease